MKLTVDASIAVKWFVAEPLGDEARTVLARRIQRYAPDLLLAECANTMWKQSDWKQRKVGAPGFEPTSGIDSELQDDHNSLTNKPQLTVIDNHPATDSTAKPQPDDTQTHRFYANSMPMSGYAALARVVAAWPGLSSEDQQRILTIVHDRGAP